MKVEALCCGLNTDTYCPMCELLVLFNVKCLGEEAQIRRVRKSLVGLHGELNVLTVAYMSGKDRRECVCT